MRGRRPPGTGRAGSSEGSFFRRFARRLRAGSARRVFFFAAVGIGLSEASAAWTEGSAVHSERMPLLSGLTPGGLRAPMSPPMHPRARERERERETDRQTETDRGREKERARHLLLNWWPHGAPWGGQVPRCQGRRPRRGYCGNLSAGRPGRPSHGEGPCANESELRAQARDAHSRRLRWAQARLFILMKRGTRSND